MGIKIIKVMVLYWLAVDMISNLSASFQLDMVTERDIFSHFRLIWLNSLLQDTEGRGEGQEDPLVEWPLLHRQTLYD